MPAGDPAGLSIRPGAQLGASLYLEGGVSIVSTQSRAASSFPGSAKAVKSGRVPSAATLARRPFALDHSSGPAWAIELVAVEFLERVRLRPGATRNVAAQLGRDHELEWARSGPNGQRCRQAHLCPT